MHSIAQKRKGGISSPGAKVMAATMTMRAKNPPMAIVRTAISKKGARSKKAIRTKCQIAARAKSATKAVCKFRFHVTVNVKNKPKKIWKAKSRLFKLFKEDWHPQYCAQIILVLLSMLIRRASCINASKVRISERGVACVIACVRHTGPPPTRAGC